MRQTLLDRYIGRSVFSSTMLVLTIIFLLFLFVSFIDELRNLGRANFGLLALTKYVLLIQPRRLYEFFPTAALLGATVGLSYLAASSELVAMRAAGVSLLRIVGSVMKVGMLFVVAGLLIGEFVVPVSEDMAERGRAEALQTGFRVKGTGLWFRNAQEFINVGEVLPDHSMLRVHIYRFDDRMNLRTHGFAQRAEYAHDAWQLRQVRESRLSSTGVTTRVLASMPWTSPLTPEDMAVFTVRPEGLSALHLFRYIQHLRTNRQETGRYELALWQKLLLPFSTAVMLMLAIPFVFTQQRSGGMGQKVFLGIMLGLMFNMLHLSFGYISLLYDMSPLLGAILPPSLFLLLTLVLLRRAA